MHAMNSPFYDSPAQAEAAFYAAIERRDLDALMQVWEDSDIILCIHPGDGRLLGRAEIRDSFGAIFAYGRRHLVPREAHVQNLGDVVIHNLTEDFSGATIEDAEMAMRATNVYRRSEHGWRMVLRQVSLQALDLLDDADPHWSVPFAPGIH
ncbi:nuclear transport factor 2 family protein [Massilia sp. W12]|uniref:nuclear transport factor 2 family protein n=1 Tax=Massilia sp. W12 TaxID=3126507 RepID=UPI0030D31B17